MLHMYRLIIRSPTIISRGSEAVDGFALIASYLPRSLPDHVTLENGRTSPLCIPDLGAAFLIVALHFLRARRQDSTKHSDVHSQLFQQAARLIGEAIDYALQQPSSAPFRGHEMGIDEVLYGRAGLLWAIILLQDCSAVAAATPDTELDHVLAGIHQRTPDLVQSIVDAGSAKSTDDASMQATVLSWPWIGNFHGLGGMHGATGILAVLLLAPYNVLSLHAHSISDTITALCRICIDHDGHLPMSVPDFPSKSPRPSPLVQLCHGAPGLLLLLACAKRNEEFRREHWQAIWNDAFERGSAKVWEQGLLSKGCGVCHGIAGNALPWLLWSEDDKDDGMKVDSPDYVGKAIAFLEECKSTPPFFQGTEEKYRTPDHPYSLFEGLAGTVLVWSEAVRLIEKRLR